MWQNTFNSIFNDMFHMHDRYQVHAAVDKMDSETFKKFMKFRLDFLNEELGETWKAYNENDAEEIVDGLIDLIVVAAGTLDLCGVDAQRAWDEVLKANMSKRVGVKDGRPNPLGLPDLVKPDDWKGPSHENNHGRLAELD